MMRIRVRDLKSALQEDVRGSKKPGAWSKRKPNKWGRVKGSRDPDDDMNNLEFIATLLYKHGPLTRRDILAPLQLRKGVLEPGAKLRPGWGSSYFAWRGGSMVGPGMKQYGRGESALWKQDENKMWYLTERGVDYVREDKLDLIDVYMV